VLNQHEKSWRIRLIIFTDNLKRILSNLIRTHDELDCPDQGKCLYHDTIKTNAFTSYFLFTGFSDIFIIISHGKYLDMIMLKIYDMKDNMKG